MNESFKTSRPSCTLGFHQAQCLLIYSKLPTTEGESCKSSISSAVVPRTLPGEAALASF